MNDPWGGKYEVVFVPKKNYFHFSSNGSDGLKGTQDDFIRFLLIEPSESGPILNVVCARPD